MRNHGMLLRLHKACRNHVYPEWYRSLDFYFMIDLIKKNTNLKIDTETAMLANHLPTT